MPMIPGVAYVMVFFSGAIFMWALAMALGFDPSKLAVRKRLQSEVIQTKEHFIIKQLAVGLHPMHRALRLQGYAAWATSKLEAAGIRMDAWQLVVVQELAAIGAGMGYVYLQSTNKDPVDPVFAVIVSMIGFGFPIFWLNGKIAARRDTVARDLPEVVDLLTLCVGAGADFMTALTRIVREFRPCPVREELAIVLSEVRVGKRRRDALKGFAQRVQTPESSTFARTLIQADRMGTGLMDALTVLSEDMRLARYHWAERFAQKAPLKMLVPLVISLASAMVIVAGPIVIRFLRGGVMGMAEIGASATQAARQQ